MQIQDLSQSGAVNFSVQLGSLHGLAILTLTDTGGVLSVTPDVAGCVVIQKSFARFYPYLNNVALVDPTPTITYNSGVPFTIAWSYSSTIPPPWQVSNIRASLYGGLMLWAVVAVVLAASTIIGIVALFRSGTLVVESVNQVVLAISLIIIVDVAVVVVVLILNAL